MAVFITAAAAAAAAAAVVQNVAQHSCVHAKQLSNATKPQAKGHKIDMDSTEPRQLFHKKNPNPFGAA